MISQRCLLDQCAYLAAQLRELGLDREFSNRQQAYDRKEYEVRWRLDSEKIGKEVGNLRENGDSEQAAD